MELLVKNEKNKKINYIRQNEINTFIGIFEKDKRPQERYASFDYCFNYFQSYKDKKELIANIQTSCLQLGFYLASWGMYRGSTFLLQKSLKVFEPLITYIGSDECDVWNIDVDNYEETDNISKLIKCGETIKNKLGRHGDKKKEATDTLITKIMLGVFGNVPAFDAYFKNASNLKNFNENALREISFFYKKNQKQICKKALETKTFKFDDNNSSKIKKQSYTKAKIIDMIYFTKGFEENKNKSIKIKNGTTG
jgi:hypothetical protein